MSPQLSLQHHYIIHKYQSQIKSTERGLHQVRKHWGIEYLWNSEPLAAPNLPSNKPGRWKNPSLLSQKALAKMNSPGGCKEPHQPCVPGVLPRAPWSWYTADPPLLAVGTTERGNVGKRGNGSETSLSPGLASSPASTPFPGAADAAGLTQLESRPQAGERITILSSTKSHPKKQYVQSSLT